MLRLWLEVGVTATGDVLVVVVGALVVVRSRESECARCIYDCVVWCGVV